MSKELIERLKSYIPNGDGYNSQYANDLADAVAILEAKAAPVGEREAFEAWFFCPSNSLLAEWEDAAWEAFQAGAAHQRQQAREVVMPERKVAQPGDVLSFQGEGWNACLDEFTRLNKGAGSHE